MPNEPLIFWSVSASDLSMARRCFPFAKTCQPQMPANGAA
jgi:hypothetical protein